VLRIIKLKPSVLKFGDYLGSAKGKEFLEEFCLAGYNAVKSVEKSTHVFLLPVSC
jgi:hypothetical protein